MTLTAERLRELVKYDPETGHIYWLGSVGKARAGQQAGTVNTHGYRRVGIDGRLYAAHRLAWLITYGEWPDGEIDHINGSRDDNRIANLRQVDTRGNARNRGLRSDNSKGVPGVYFNRNQGNWYAQSCHGGKNKHLGTFPTFDEAVEARRVFQQRHGYHPNHGRTSGSEAARAGK